MSMAVVLSHLLSIVASVFFDDTWKLFGSLCSEGFNYLVMRAERLFIRSFNACGFDPGDFAPFELRLLLFWGGT